MAKHKAEQNNKKGKLLKSHKPDMLPGVDHQISIYQPSVVVDCHMHIQSGNSAPLPFMWAQAGPLSSVRMKRVTLQTNAARIDKVFDGANAFRSSAHTTENMAATADQKELYRTHKLRTALDVSKSNTYEVGKSFIKRQNEVYKDYLSKDPLYRNAPHLMFMGVVMTMDMEYAHLDGYYGLKVCNAIYTSGEDIARDKDPIGYWAPLHKLKDRDFGNQTYKERKDDRKAPLDYQTNAQFEKSKGGMANQGIPGVYYDDAGRPFQVNVKADIFLLDGEAAVANEGTQQPENSNVTARYEQWKKQAQYTELAMLAHPLKLLPLFHYDPRRWQVQDEKNAKAFEQVSGSGLYLGFKMYTAQGYRPWDPRLPVLRHFYARCVTERIPIMNHCTPDGAPTFDREEYINFQHPLDNMADIRQKEDKAPQILSSGKKIPPRSLNPLDYFNDNFVAPKAWENVLDQEVFGNSLNTLRLCLAHFGGNTETGREWFADIVRMIKSEAYPNLYTDISSSFCKKEFRDFFKAEVMKDKAAFDKILRHRILFGTDWYLTLLDGRDYREYCETAKNFLDDMDTSLWIRFTQVNPYRFYRLDEEIERIAGNIVDRRQKDKKTIDFFGNEIIKQKEIDDIYKEAAYIKIANKFFVNYEES